MAYKKSIGRPSNQAQKKAQRRWAAFLSTVTCATVLGMPSLMTQLQGGNLGEPAIAQTAVAPSLPSSLPQGSSLKIDGSGSLAAMNRALKEKFEGKYQGSTVSVATGGTAAGLKALEAGQVDLASIGRPLTPEEKAKGLIAIPIKREKIAMLVGEGNPFRGSLTIRQFAKIFRGEITNWKEVGGADQAIRLVDQPEVSDTRNAFSGYPVFKEAPFQAVAGAVASGSENPEDIASKLGADGLGYVTADGVKNLTAARALDMHKVQPDDKRYPFSQPIGYVYKKGSKLSPATQAFLGYLGTEEAKAAIQSVSSPGAVLENSQASIAEALAGAAAGGTATTATPSSSSTPSATNPSPVAAASNNTTATNPIAAPATAPTTDAGIGFPWWLVLLGLLGAGLAWWLLKKPKSEGAIGGTAGTTGTTGTTMGGAIETPTVIPPTVPVAEPVATTPTPEIPELTALEPTAPELTTPELTAPELTAPELTTPELDLAPIAGAAAGAGVVAAGAAAIIEAGAPIVETDPREQASSAILSDLDDETCAIDHDCETHGAGTVQVNPRDAAGDSGGLKFPAIDPGIAAAVIGGAAGVAAIGGLLDQKDELIVEPIAEPMIEPIAEPIAKSENDSPVPAVNLPLEPITQLPPNVHPPIELTDEPAPPHVESVKPVESMQPVESETSSSSNLPLELGAVGTVVTGAVVAGAVLTGGASEEPTPKPPLSAAELAGVDDNLPDLPQGYGESRIVLMGRDPQWGYTYWDVPNDHRQSLRDQGGQQLALRLYDVTDIDLNSQNPHSLQQYSCDEMARDWYLPIPVSDREYLTEIGYLTATGGWLLLARSNTVRIPPVYPSDWIDDQFITVDWDESLQSRTFLQLVPPGSIANALVNDPGFDNSVFGVSQADQAARMAGSLFGSMHQVPYESLSSFVFPSGMGMWANEAWMLPTPSGMGMSGVGYYTMSGIGMGASMPPERSRKFWLIADAELIVYGATEPDAQVTIGGVPVQLTPEGTFRFQMSFQDGNLDFPIMAIAKDGEQMRQVRMTFDRSTPLRQTNTKEAAQDESY